MPASEPASAFEQLAALSPRARCLAFVRTRGPVAIQHRSWPSGGLALDRVERVTRHGQFSPTLEPALTVDVGDKGRYHTPDVLWGIENHKEGDLSAPEVRAARATA